MPTLTKLVVLLKCTPHRKKREKMFQHFSALKLVTNYSLRATPSINFAHHTFSGLHKSKLP